MSHRAWQPKYRVCVYAGAISSLMRERRKDAVLIDRYTHGGRRGDARQTREAAAFRR